MKARLYKAKVSVMRDQHTRIFVYDYMISATDRAKARKIAGERAYTYGADWVHIELECLPNAASRLSYKILEAK